MMFATILAEERGIRCLDGLHYRRMTGQEPGSLLKEMRMKTANTRREFLAEVGCGMMVASVGYSVATELGLSPALASEVNDRLTFGAIEPLVSLMQETPADQLATKLVSQIRSGVPLQRLVEAAALANARTFGG